MVRERAKSFLPSYGEVPASYAGDGVMSHGLRLLTPPSRYERDTSPSAWGGC
jgi:hypothetical protein